MNQRWFWQWQCSVGEQQNSLSMHSFQQSKPYSWPWYRMAEGHKYQCFTSLIWRQSPRGGAWVIQTSTASSTFSFPTDGHKWKWHGHAWFTGIYTGAKTSKSCLTGREFEFFFPWVCKENMVWRGFPSYRSSKGYKTPLHLHCFFLIQSFLFNVVQGFDLFTLKNHQADNRNSKQSNALPPQGEIKKMKEHVKTC